MEMIDASAVCWNDINKDENNSVIKYISPEYRAKELFNYSRESWVIVDKFDEPQGICGVIALSQTTVEAWCFVATKNKNVWVHLARKAKETAQRLFVDTHVRRIHALVSLSRPEPLKYSRKIGMNELCRMPNYGTGDRAFALMSVTKEEWLGL